MSRRGPQDIQSGALTGVVQTTKSAGACTVNVNGVVRTVQVARDLTVAVGDIAVIVRIGALWAAVARLYTAAPESSPPDQDMPDSNPTSVSGTLTILPVYTGSYRDGAWRTESSDLIQGARGGYGNSTGAAFYGDKPASLAGATVTAARVTMRRTAGAAAAAAPTLWRVTETTVPAGAPTLPASTAGPSLGIGEATTFAIPTAWAQSMVDGTAGGLAVYTATSTPWLGYAGRGTDPAAFTLAIDWTR